MFPLESADEDYASKLSNGDEGLARADRVRMHLGRLARSSLSPSDPTRYPVG